MKTLQQLMQQETLNVIGLMSGTSADGLDAALVRIQGSGTGMQVRQLSFVSVPWTDEERKAILRLAEGREGGTREICLFNFWFGHKSLEACIRALDAAYLGRDDVDLVGSHGQTLYHIPYPEEYLGHSLCATLQPGEPSVIAEGLGCPVVSDFRVRDMAAGGQGAPLVPYAEYLLYRREDRHVGLQNIGGIGNITVLPKGCTPDEVYAFDTGPGNMVMDALTVRFTGGAQRYDRDGRIAAEGRWDPKLLSFMMQDPFLRRRPPKTTGREMYGVSYVNALVEKGRALGLSDRDILATATRFTAECVGTAIEAFCDPRPEELIVGGGGSANPVLMRELRSRLDIPVRVNEDFGFDSDAKEAVAFAVLAAECIRGVCNNMPAATGARHGVVMGKITQ